jgi:hypothetical protein
MMNRGVVVSALVVAAVGVPAPARAQTLSQLMLSVFTLQIAAAKTPGGEGIVAHTGTFTQNDATDVTTLVQQVSGQIGAQVSNVPLGSSSGGFTYKYDPARGSFTRSTETFGPAFAERADTVGRHRFSFGMNYQYGRYTSLDGKSLENGDIKFFLPHQQLNPPNFVQGDMIEADVRLKLSSDATVFFADYGVTNAFEVAVAVPLDRVSMNLTYHATIDDFATHATAPQTHLFPNGTKVEDFTADGSATGIGDMIVRAKYSLAKGSAQGLAMGLDLRLPTGDAANMLGTGATQAEFYAIASSTQGRLAPHANVGYTVANNGVSNQFNYVGGLEFAASPKLTIVGDVLGRTFRTGTRIVDNPTLHIFQESNGGPNEAAILPTIGTESAGYTSVLATVGAKFNPYRTLLVSAHLVFTLTNAGLKRGVTPVIGFDYSY